jgi:hypothetical protein
MSIINWVKQQFSAADEPASSTHDDQAAIRDWVKGDRKFISDTWRLVTSIQDHKNRTVRIYENFERDIPGSPGNTLSIWVAVLEKNGGTLVRTVTADERLETRRKLAEYTPRKA